jgi:hypothetical protein
MNALKSLNVHAKEQLLLSDFNESLNVLNRHSRNPKTPNFLNIRPVGAEMFGAEGQADVT